MISVELPKSFIVIIIIVIFPADTEIIIARANNAVISKRIIIMDGSKIVEYCIAVVNS